MTTGLDIKISAGSLMRFALPTILSCVFMNIYSMLDSLFVAKFIDTDALSAVSIVGPFLAVALALGTMIAAGGTALVSKQLGEGKRLEARRNFSFLLCFCTLVSAVFCLIGLVFREPILRAMGADSALYPTCEAYAVPIFLIIPFAMVGILLQMFFVAEGKPGFGFALSMVGGTLNVALDLFFLAVMKLGVAGAAYGTCVAYVIQGGVGLVYFAVRRGGNLCLVKPKWNSKALRKACSNGMSEMVGMLAVSVTMVVMNIVLMRLAGSDGVAAAAIVLSAQTILSAVYMGYLEGIAPLISYNYGKRDTDSLKKLCRIALRVIAALSVLTCAAAFPLARPIAVLYAEGAADVIALSRDGIFAISGAFLLMGVNMFASSLFTALNDGKTSAILALFRTLVFLIVPLLALPPIFGIWGVWIAPTVAELFSVLMSIYYFRAKKSVYQYA